MFPTECACTADSFNFSVQWTGFFTNIYFTSHGMAVHMENIGAIYPATFVDAEDDLLSRNPSYKLSFPEGIPATLFWSAGAYGSISSSGLDNSQPFPSINTMDKPAAGANGSADIYFGSSRQGLARTVPAPAIPRFLRDLWLYGPTKPIFDRDWRPRSVANRLHIGDRRTAPCSPPVERSGSKPIRIHLPKPEVVDRQ